MSYSSREVANAKQCLEEHRRNSSDDNYSNFKRRR